MKKFRVEFSENLLTGNAGLTHFGRFIKKLNLKKIIDNNICIPRGSNAEYQVSDVVIILIIGAIAGVKHMSQIAILRIDEVLRTLFNWDQFPADSTLGRIFKLFTQSSCNQLSEVENIIRRKVWGKKWFGRITLELDSSVRGVYGSQEGAEAGYNPKKKNQKSYHPLFCFISETRECLHNWFRAGNAYSGNGAVEFIQECYSRLPKRVWKIFVRGDSAFFNGALLDVLEEKGALYLIKVKLKNLTKILTVQEWKQIKNRPGYEGTEFEYQCTGWTRPRRFVAIREYVKKETEEGIEYETREYCYVTNERLSPWKAHKTYGQRAASENWIDWCKNHVGGGSILTQDFWANSAIFQCSIFAYNLIVWMMFLCKGEKLREEPNTIRFWLINVPGKLLTSSRQYVIKLSKNWYYKKKWLEIEHFLDKVQFT